LIWSCNNTNENGDENLDPKDQQIKQLQAQLDSKDSTVNSMFSFVNDVEDNLNSVEASQMKIIQSKKGNNEVNQDVKESIMEHIQNINTLLEKNKKLIARLESALRKSNMKVDALQKTIDLLNQQMTQKDAEIADLKVQLEKLNFTVIELNAKVVELTDQNDQKTQLIDQQTVELNTAYYVVGFRKDLKTKGVIVGDKLSQKINPENFVKIDIRTTTEIKLNVKRAKLLSTHPEGSYTMLMNGKIIDKLVVNNPKTFWSISKFLVIQTD
jgi:chromosome segregation ATPase